ncbi:ATP-binding cassette domain-containing protein [Flavobacterium sp. N2270]|uniref:ABC transporter ATP-binding protein n=1 Tax=Flavobacterium sp. N2270 TaxID=2986831 RepID=UPI002224EFB1|nr:ATP-binding cassette domain-containing protein [Flavobacterium sp. N2270]
MIEIKNLSKSFGKNEVLNNLNLSFEKGKVYGIVGENGSGKTTFFKCLAGLESFQGEVTCEYGIMKEKLGFLQTESFFFSKITGREYLQLLCTARKVENLDFDDKNIFDLPLDQYAVTYSTGMKKKLALTSILLQKNELFILDEPFNGVDIQSNMIITAIIHELKRLNKTVIISSHIFSTLNDNCDEILVLKKGEITKKIKKEDFTNLENEMKEFSITNKIERLNL